MPRSRPVALARRSSLTLLAVLSATSACASSTDAPASAEASRTSAASTGGVGRALTSRTNAPIDLDPEPTAPATTSPSTTMPSASDLTGRWQDRLGNVYEFVRTASGQYAGEVIGRGNGVCLPVVMRVSGAGSHYDGTEAFYTSLPDCGPVTGHKPISIDLTSPTTATLTWHVTACSNCDDLRGKWTRSPGPLAPGS
jgi:hypothetical protein